VPSAAGGAIVITLAFPYVLPLMIAAWALVVVAEKSHWASFVPLLRSPPWAPEERTKVPRSLYQCVAVPRPIDPRMGQEIIGGEKRRPIGEQEDLGRAQLPRVLSVRFL